MKKTFSYDQDQRLVRESWFQFGEQATWEFLHSYEYFYNSRETMHRIHIHYPDNTYSAMYLDETTGVWIWETDNEQSYWQY